MSWFRSRAKQDAGKQESSSHVSKKEPESGKESSTQAEKYGEIGPSDIVGGDQGSSSHGSESILITIPNAIVHQVDGNESAHLATGPLSLVRRAQNGNGIAVFAKVGDDLQWPLGKDAHTSKLDNTHYFFTFTRREPPEADDDAEESTALREDGQSTLSYGVTLLDDGGPTVHAMLDKLLERYSALSLPQGEDDDPERKAEVDKDVKEKGYEDREFSSGEPDPPAKPTIIPRDAKTTTAPDSITDPAEKSKYIEERNAAYWTTYAHNVDDYRGPVAKGIAKQSNKVIKGLFWCSDAMVRQLERLGDYLKAHISKNERPTRIHPLVMQNLRGVKSTSRMMDRIAKWILAGLITVTGLASGTVMSSRAGKKIFTMLPGQVALVSLDAFTRVFDAVEIAGKSVLISTRVVTCGVVSHRYGEVAAEATHEGLSIVGHVLSAAWTISKIPKAFNPSKVTKRGVVKSVLKGKW